MPTAAELFERHHRSVFRFLRRATGSTHDAEDLTQDVFLRVLRALDGYEDRHLERAWLFRIARNVWLDHWRGRRRAPATTGFGDGGRHIAYLPARQVSGLALDEALARLGDAEREAFLMREVAGLGHVEIAEATEATPGAVRSRIHRARLALRKTLGSSDLPSGAGRQER